MYLQQKIPILMSHLTFYEFSDIPIVIINIIDYAQGFGSLHWQSMCIANVILCNQAYNEFSGIPIVTFTMIDYAQGFGSLHWWSIVW